MNNKILEYYKLVYKVLNDMGIHNPDKQDELFFYGLMGLYNGIRTYIKRDTKESTYYYTCIKNEIVKTFHYNSMDKRNYIKYEVSINTQLNDKQSIADTLASDIDIEKEIIKKEQWDLIIDTLNKTKNTMWKQYICEFYGIGLPQMNIKEMALKYGIKAHAIQSSILQGIKRLRKKVLKEYERKNK